MHVSERDFLKECMKECSSKTNEQKIIYTLWTSCFLCVLLISIKHKLCRDHLLDIPTKLVPIGMVSEKKIKM